MISEETKRPATKSIPYKLAERQVIIISWQVLPEAMVLTVTKKNSL